LNQFHPRQLWRLAYTVMGLLLRRPLVGTCIIPVLEDGRIVLVKRRDNGCWALPGGFVDWGEDLPSSVARELREETGLQVLEIRRLVGVYSAADRDYRTHSICVAVEAIVQGTLTVEDALEVEAIQAFALDALPHPLSHDHDRHIRDYLSGATTLA
jgi:8-oxo-dGTP diphosphatase